jgi:hypothetical protein
MDAQVESYILLHSMPFSMIMNLEDIVFMYSFELDIIIALFIFFKRGKSAVNTLAINAVELASAFTRFKVGATHSELLCQVPFPDLKTPKKGRQKVFFRAGCDRVSDIEKKQG